MWFSTRTSALYELCRYCCQAFSLWPCGRQSDVGLCGRMGVSLICRALWPCGCQSDMSGFVAAWLSVWYAGLCGRVALKLMHCALAI